MMVPDSLEAALRSVPLNELEIYYPALAAAVREWMCTQLKSGVIYPMWEPAFAEMARRLGL